MYQSEIFGTDFFIQLHFAGANLELLNQTSQRNPFWTIGYLGLAGMDVFNKMATLSTHSVLLARWWCFKTDEELKSSKGGGKTRSRYKLSQLTSVMESSRVSVAPLNKSIVQGDRCSDMNQKKKNVCAIALHLQWNTLRENNHCKCL